jgi:4-hydroxy-tetrahydrodipicolinate reductase
VKRIVVFGASGRMGQAVVRQIAADPTLRLVGAVSRTVGSDAGAVANIRDLGVPTVANLASVTAEVDVVVDFSSPSQFQTLLKACADRRIAFVSGTTGITAADREALEAAARSTAVLWEPNTSLGVFVLSRLVAMAGELLGSDFDAEIVEVHHRAKVDAPSGTAVRLGEVLQAGRETRVVEGRSGRPGPRSPAELGVFAVRGGDVIGDHTVHFLGPMERLELTHRATNRDVFARGAVRAAHWISGRAPGRYSLGDVLGLNGGL